MLWLLSIPALIGLVLLVRGWRGRRVDDHPLCRGCGYDLVASADAAACPECGRDVQQAGAIRIGHRRRRPVFLTVGTMLLLAALGAGGFLGWSHAARFNWNPYKPLWMLRTEAAGTNAISAVAAQREVLARLGNGRLSQSQIDSIVAEGLDAQANQQATWHGWWGDFIEQAWQLGKTSDQSIHQYARTAVDSSISIDIPQRVRANGRLLIGHTRRNMRAGTSGTLGVDIEYGEVRLEDGTQISRGGGKSRTSIRSGGTGRSAGGSSNRLPVGEYAAVAEIHVRISPGVMLQASVPFGQDVEPDPSKPLLEYDITRQVCFEVVADDVEIVERVRDESMREAFVAATSIGEIRVLGTPRGATFLADIDIVDAPMPAAFQVIARLDDREWPIASVTVTPGERARSGPASAGIAAMPFVQGFPVDAQRVDIVLRASSAHAERAGFARIWDGEIIIKDVTLERVQPR